jgi:hypothetical protein
MGQASVLGAKAAESLPLAEVVETDPSPAERRDRPRRRRFADFADDSGDEAYSRRIRRGSSADLTACMRAANSGLTCSLLGLGFLLIAFFLWLVMAGAQPRPGTKQFLVVLTLLTVLGSFLLCLLGVIFSGRGLKPINESNRGVAIAGLVSGIIGLIISSVVGLVLMCVGLVLLANPSQRVW